MSAVATVPHTKCSSRTGAKLRFALSGPAMNTVLPVSRSMLTRTSTACIAARLVKLGITRVQPGRDLPEYRTTDRRCPPQ